MKGGTGKHPSKTTVLSLAQLLAGQPRRRRPAGSNQACCLRRGFCLSENLLVANLALALAAGQDRVSFAVPAACRDLFPTLRQTVKTQFSANGELCHGKTTEVHENVTSEEKEKLAMLARRPKSAQAIAMRARIVLGCEEGLSNGEVAKKLQITGATVGKWRERFRLNRLEGLLDEPRPGAPRSITDAQVEDVVTKTLESMPQNSTHWSTRWMAKKADRYRADLARFRATTASRGELQALQRPAVRGEGPGYRRVVHEPARSRHCAVRRRKESAAGVESDAADSSPGAGGAGTAIP
jgi:transposase